MSCELEVRWKQLAERYIELTKTMTAKVNELRRNKNASADELNEFLADIEADSKKIDEIDNEIADLKSQLQKWNATKLGVN